MSSYEEVTPIVAPLFWSVLTYASTGWLIHSLQDQGPAEFEVLWQHYHNPWKWNHRQSLCHHLLWSVALSFDWLSWQLLWCLDTVKDILRQLWGVRVNQSMSTRLQSTSTSFEFQTSHVRSDVASPCCWSVELKALEKTLVCYVMIPSMRSRFEKSYLCSILYSYYNLKSPSVAKKVESQPEKWLQ